jgi:Na+/melibiose symporter-like transporter
MPVFLRLAGLFPGNASDALVPSLFLFNTIDVSLIIAASILVSSMVADVVEDSETSTGRRSEGLFFAARSFVAKCVSGIGVFLSTVLLAVVGFPSGAKPGEVDPGIIWNLGAVFGPTLIVLYSVSVACLAGYRISREGHGENLRRLDARRAPS